MEKINELTSENIVQQNIERLKEIFPTAFSEGKLVVDELQALVGEYIDKDKEFYQMTWAGKAEAQKEANKVSTGTLRPNKADSKDWDITGNIFIEGDNLEVLKLLQKTYSNKIKMIYIDPPYNTGNDFVYKDNYKDNLSNYLEITGQTNKDGKKNSTNTDSDGRYHSNWLNMMYPRLKLARNLMTDDGVIFISIDDNEQANLKKICDEIFGEENFIDILKWKRKKQPSFLAKHTAKVIEYVFVYSKNYDLLEKLSIEGTSDSTKKVINISNPESERFFKTGVTVKSIYNGIIPKGKYKSKTMTVEYCNDIIVENGKTINEVKVVSRFSVTQDNISKFIDEHLLFITSNNGLRRLVSEEEMGKRKSITDLLLEGWGDNQDSDNEQKKLFNAKFFDYTKPLQLIKNFIKSNYTESNYILDFFSGSGTTAHAVMALNAEDGGNRKCISVQLPEPTDENSETYKAGYETIAEITKERIRRAGELIKQENKGKENIDKLDIGFRAFTLDSSNIQAWDTSVDKFEDQLNMFEENNGDSIKSDRSEEDVLFEILLKYGLDLTLPIQEKEIDGCKVYNIGYGSMYICLGDQIKISVAKGISEWHKDSADKNPSVIFKDSGFANDADKTNTVQTLRQAGIENVKSI